MKMLLSTIILFSSLISQASTKPSDPMTGELTYGKFDRETALIAIEGPAADMLYKDMAKVRAQVAPGNLYIKVGKSVTCFRGPEDGAWKTTCFIGFSSLTNGLVDSSQTLQKP